MLPDQPDSLIRKHRLFPRIPSLRQPEIDQFTRLRFSQRIQYILQCNPVPEVADIANPRQQFELPHKDQLKNLVLVSLIIEQNSKNLKNKRRQNLGLINQQNDRLALLHATLE